MSYSKAAPKRYFLEVMAALALMLAIVMLRQFLLHSTSAPALILAARLLPILPVLIIGIAVYRLYRSRDEFQQQVMLKSTAAAGLLAMLIFMAYAPLNALGLPPFSRQIGLFILGASYILCGTVFAFLHERAISGTRQAFRWLAPVTALLLPAAYWVVGFVLPLPPLSFRLAMVLFVAGAFAFGFYRIFIRPTDL
jgi:hypothetical protein